MGSSRRQRAKNEGTFLESVKASLHAVRFDIDAIKRILEQLPAFSSEQTNMSSWAQFPLHALSYADGESNDWNWQGIWEPMSFHQGAFGHSTVWTIPAAHAENEKRNSDKDIPASLSREELLQYHMQSLSQTVPEELEHLHSRLVTLDLRTWQPASSNVFANGSALGFELQNEAASVRQRSFLVGEFSTIDENEEDVTIGDDDADTDEGCYQSDGENDNSAEAVATRRAFLASVTPSVAGAPPDEKKWTGDEILSWLTGAMDLAVAVDDRQKAVKTFWLEWSRIDRFLPPDRRQQIVHRLDQNMMVNGYPGLRSMMS